MLHGDGKLLTAALSKGYGGSKVPASVFEHFDFVNIMAYDGAGPWNPNAPGQHSSLKFAKDNATYWLDRGLPKSKAVLGVPFYGYGFGEAFRKGGYSYKAILAAHPGRELRQDRQHHLVQRHSDDPSQEPIRGRAWFGRVMIWELSHDVPGVWSLLAAIHETLTAASLDVKS